MKSDARFEFYITHPLDPAKATPHHVGRPGCFSIRLPTTVLANEAMMRIAVPFFAGASPMDEENALLLFYDADSERMMAALRQNTQQVDMLSKAQRELNTLKSRINLDAIMDDETRHDAKITLVATVMGHLVHHGYAAAQEAQAMLHHAGLGVSENQAAALVAYATRVARLEATTQQSDRGEGRAV